MRTLRNLILLVFSLFFYAWGGISFLLVMLCSIIIHYLCGLLASFHPKLAIWIAAICGVGMLFYFKYLTFFLSSFFPSMQLPPIVMPIGISFFTFQGLSYVVDVARKDAPPQKNPLWVALYISLFPQLIAGPIVRYQTIAAELSNRTESLSEVATGLRRFCFGLGKKMLLANSMGMVADKLFGIPATELTWDAAWLGALAYTFQIYFDFSGYSDMAIGLGNIFGFHFLENFRFPYLSRSVTEFWRRWHISLGAWFRDYVYIPLGGNRVSFPRWIFNLFTVWMLTGIWHGANWTFLCWGLYFGILLLLEKWSLPILMKIPAFLQWAYTFLLVLFGWVLFRADTLSHALHFLKTMFLPTAGLHRLTRYCLEQYWIAFLICMVASFPVSHFLRKISALTIFSYLAAFLVLLLSILWLVSSSFNPFIYFRF